MVAWTTIAVLTLSTLAWLYGLINSSILDPELRADKQYGAIKLNEEKAADTELRLLAEAYWLRYPDIRNHHFFGENGPNGLAGAREHYRQHGRYEGRIYGPLAEIGDLQREKLLAEAYWRRYPEVALSPVWGRKSKLGIRGPRDHYRYIGVHQDKVWGEEEQRQRP